jgi:hypothetical protein
VSGQTPLAEYTLSVLAAARVGSTDVKKGRHRRFEEARALKRSTEVMAEPCPECGADPEDDHASWCLFEEDDGEESQSQG